jgi:hypothetical protein
VARDEQARRIGAEAPHIAIDPGDPPADLVQDSRHAKGRRRLRKIENGDMTAGCDEWRRHERKLVLGEIAPGAGVNEHKHRRVRRVGAKPVEPVVRAVAVRDIQFAAKHATRFGAPADVARHDLVGIPGPRALVVVVVELGLRVVQEDGVGHCVAGLRRLLGSFFLHKICVEATAPLVPLARQPRCRSGVGNR